MYYFCLDSYHVAKLAVIRLGWQKGGGGGQGAVALQTFLLQEIVVIGKTGFNEMRASQPAQASERVGSLIPASQQG